MADMLIVLTVGLPLLGALAMWLAGARRSLAPITLAIACLGATGVSALLVLFLPLEGTRYMTQSLAFFTVLGAAIGSLVMAAKLTVSFKRGKVREGRHYTWHLLLVGALLGVSMLQNSLLMYFSFCLLVFSSYRLLFPSDLVEAIQGDIQENRERHRYDM